MKTEKDNSEKIPRRKLCSNCAYRGTCNKRFNAQVSDGQVRCLEHSFDVALLNRQDAEEEPGNA
jgi:hypothetical protein